APAGGFGGVAAIVVEASARVGFVTGKVYGRRLPPRSARRASLRGEPSGSCAYCGPWPVEWYRCPSAARVACRAANVCCVCSRARRRSRHRLTHRASLVFTMLTSPVLWKSHGRPGWPLRCSAPDPGLVMPANVSAQAQSRFQAYARAAKPALSRSGPALTGVIIGGGPLRGSRAAKHHGRALVPLVRGRRGRGGAPAESAAAAPGSGPACLPDSPRTP